VVEARLSIRKIAAEIAAVALTSAVVPSLAAPLAGGDPGTVRITLDGQDQNVHGTLWCTQNPNGKFSIGIDRTFGVVMTPGTPPVVDSVVFPYGSFAGMGMEFATRDPGTGQAVVEKHGDSYKITGEAADAAHSYKTTRPFEIDVTCPSASSAQTPSAPTSAPGSAPAPVSKPAVVSPPKHLDAPPAAIATARTAPATRVNPANPPPPPTHVDVAQQVQSVVSAHGGNVDVVTVDNQALVRPQVWDYIDYDVYHRPALYNPISQAMTFHFFYSGAYRDVYVAPGGRVVLDVPAVGVFPFTAVSDSYVVAGSFYGGAWIPPEGWSGPPPPDYTPPAPPTVYRDVLVDVPAVNQAVQVGQVTPVGHDDSQPAGSQDTFMLDDSTLAWGQATNPEDGGHITVTKTQSLPGIGPMDNGGVLVALAAHHQSTRDWTSWVLGGLLAVAVGLIAWLLIRRNRVSD
jgi:hypothetical protein